MRLVALLAIAGSLCAFEYKPWFGKLWEFEFRPAYTFRYYDDVQNGFNPKDYSSIDQLLECGLGLSPWPTIDVQFEMNYADTHRHSWSYLSTALLFRYLVWDDIAGDPVSWTLNASIRSVHSHFLNDVSIPYHANLNLDLTTAVGKEFDKLYNWVVRFWGLFGFGIGNRGAPYLTGLARVEGNLSESQIVGIVVDSLWGLGGQQGVNANHFNSYANIEHQSIDVGGRYSYQFGVWGELLLSYTYRVYAHNFPEHAQTARVEYRLPFAVF